LLYFMLPSLRIKICYLTYFLLPLQRGALVRAAAPSFLGV
jgi:hypothetical protein